jgi:hypothetical protein
VCVLRWTRCTRRGCEKNLPLRESHGEDFVQRSTDLANNGISGDYGHCNVNMWKRRALSDCSLSDAGSVAGACPRTRACSSARAGPGPCPGTSASTGAESVAGAIWWRSVGNDFAEPGPLEQQSDPELLARQHVDLYADSGQPWFGGNHPQ